MLCATHFRDSLIIITGVYSFVFVVSVLSCLRSPWESRGGVELLVVVVRQGVEEDFRDNLPMGIRDQLASQAAPKR